jgi:hypothetical protein
MFISKRVLIIAGVAAAVVIGLTVFAFVFFLSQPNRSVASSSPTPTPIASATATRTALRICAQGVVQTINSSNSSFVLSKGAKTVTVMFDSTTIFRNRGKSVTSSDLAVGDQVRVIAQGTCDRTAQSFSAQIVMIVPGRVPPGSTPAVSPTP